jgi:hypothetical protein
MKGASIMRWPGRGASQKPKSPSEPAVGSPPGQTGASPAAPTAAQQVVDLERRRDVLKARVAELQWDLGGLVYEMATRERIRVDVLVKRAALLQDADSELGEIERILKLEHTATAGSCTACGAPHSTGASFCWSCGQPILQQVPSDSIFS